MKDLHIVDIDYTGSNSAYRKEDLVDTSTLSGFWIVPEEAPFYTDSLRILNGGSFLTKGVDYEPVEPVTDLTVKTGKSVSLYIELKPHLVNNQHNLIVIYQKVGSPVISRKTLLKLLEDMSVSGGIVDFNKNVINVPATVPSAHHLMDMTNPDEMIGFGGLVELFKHFTADEKSKYAAADGLLEKAQQDIFDQLNLQHKTKKEQLFSHIQNYLNPHGLKPSDIELGNLGNFDTARPHQDLDGDRNDLYSTPYGLHRVIEETEPETDPWILQNELPLSFYGTGIYLPPPINSGVVESTVEHQNGVFVKEANGWIIGLVKRTYGGTRGLYYIYNDKLINRYNKDKFKHSNERYTNSAFTTAGLTPDSVLSGSGDDFIVTLDSVAKRGFISYNNSSLDTRKHQYKEIDFTLIKNAVGSEDFIANSHFAKIGDYIYLFVNTNQINEEEALGNYIPAGLGEEDRSRNWTTKIYRFLVSEIKSASSFITPVLVILNYDNVDRVRRNNQNRFNLCSMVKGEGSKLLSSLVTYNEPVVNFSMGKRRSYFILENPNNKTQARVRILAPHFCNTRQGGKWFVIVVDYLFDTVTNTLSLDPNWVKPALNVFNNTFTNLNEQQYLKEIALGSLESFCLNGSEMTNSWVVGFGPITVTSSQGLRDRMKKIVDNAINACWPNSIFEPKLDLEVIPPLSVVYLQSNPWGNHFRDYESLGLPVNQLNEIDDLNSFSEIMLVNKNDEGIDIPSYPWVLRISTDLEVVFNGISVKAKQTVFNLSGIATVYKNTTFYLYCCLNGSTATYEITKQLRFTSGVQLLVAKVSTNEVGISGIERYSPIAISGFPITRIRETGIPASEGLLSETGEYKFLKASELIS